jgi:hypothetical protein
MLNFITAGFRGNNTRPGLVVERLAAAEQKMLEGATYDTLENI